MLRNSERNTHAQYTELSTHVLELFSVVKSSTIEGRFKRNRARFVSFRGREQSSGEERERIRRLASPVPCFRVRCGESAGADREHARARILGTRNVVWRLRPVSYC